MLENYRYTHPRTHNNSNSSTKRFTFLTLFQEKTPPKEDRVSVDTTALEKKSQDETQTLRSSLKLDSSVERSNMHKDSVRYQPDEFSNRQFVQIRDLNKHARKVLKILFTSEEYRKFFHENIAIPLDLLDLAYESITKFTESDELVEAEACDEDFDEDDEFGFCFNEEEDFKIEDLLCEQIALKKSKRKKDKSKAKMLDLYSKYERNPIILDSR